MLRFAQRKACALALPCCFALSVPQAADAHAVLERKEAAPNAAYRGVVQIMHGCEGQPTTRVTVTIPEGVIGAKAMPKPGWQITSERGAYAKPYQSFHGTVSEGVKSISWSGGSLPDDQVDEFTFFARVSDAFAPGSTVYFPVVQDCAKGSIAWSEVPQGGQEAKALKSPAPGVRIRAASAEAPATTGSTSTRAGSLDVRTPWLRATPGGASVAGGYVTVANEGGTPDRLVGASIDRAARGEIHTMSVEDGVMKMAPVEGGLAIEPGKSVELKPGGLHLMFLDLKRGLNAGETVSGTLVFEKAGTVPVTFAVAPIGARAPGGEAGGQAGGQAAGGHHNH